MLNHHAKVIVNPMSSGGITRLKWPRIERLLTKSGLKFDCDFTEMPGHATQIARQAAANGYELVMSVGGDGTVHEVVNGLIDSSGKSKTTLGVISAGTGNDFARSIGILGAYRKTTGQLAMAAKKTIDVGRVECTKDGKRKQRIFINMAGVGFDAAVLKATKDRFRVVSSIPYWISGIYTSLRYKAKNMTISIDGKASNKRALGVIINNGASFAGGMRLSPWADLADGVLDAVVLGDINAIGFIKGLAMAYKGTLKNHPKVDMHKVKTIEVSSKEQLYIEADGELLGTSPAKFIVLPQALQVAVYNAS
ncbi:MAG: diacylglycerol kinase family lipid kinase [Chloroflexi bacterium]|jgi:diacylglycerol kinase (ATP)|nr:diacylglycerol kinase family lipid kinase [Chloroflexota bacterium]MBT7082400.1 diacylglycerol kinase family lipid kinase [Chloroflexota bacterium]MBT7290640.1 diacylglycerol kinase family lipid kinase [Chloroflexota bacterium]